MSQTVSYEVLDPELEKKEVHKILDKISTKTCKEWQISRSDSKRLEFKCKNTECNWHIGFYLTAKGWNKIMKWNETHSEQCPYNGPATTMSNFIRRCAVETVGQIETPTKSKTIFAAKLLTGITTDMGNKEQYKIQNAASYYRKKKGLTLAGETDSFQTYLNGLEKKGFEIKKQNDDIFISMPFAKRLVHYFNSPLFIDGTHTSDDKTITHVTVVTTTNQIVLVGLALSKTENGETVSTLLKLVVGEEKVGVMSDEGLAMKAGIASLGRNCAHVLCVWHLSKQMPKTLLINGKEANSTTTKDLLYKTARGTSFTFGQFKKIMVQSPDTLSKFESIKDKWCRKYICTLRRDYISSVSEALNGAVKKTALDHNQVRLSKAFISHSLRAYEECCQDASKLTGELMPLTDKYYSINLEAGKYFEYKKDKNKFKVYYDGTIIATITKNKEGLLNCNCGQDKDVGLPCAHLLGLEEVDPFTYTNKMWRVDTFKKAFNESTTPCVSGKIHSSGPSDQSNKTKIINAVRLAGTISNSTTNAILQLLKNDK